MTARFAPRLEVLPKPQRDLWPRLAPLASAGWVLYGGTAVALRLGHRHSVDFDFFRHDALDRAELYRLLPWLQRAMTLQDAQNSLTVLAGKPGQSGVKFSFFGGIAFGRVAGPAMTRDGVVRVASAVDLLATKLKVLLQRVEAKDYRDIAALLRARAGLARGLAAARVLFGPSFQPSEALKALVYFEGGDLADLSQVDRQTLLAATRRVVRLPSMALASTRLSE